MKYIKNILVFSLIISLLTGFTTKTTLAATETNLENVTQENETKKEIITRFKKIIQTISQKPELSSEKNNTDIYSNEIIIKFKTFVNKQEIENFLQQFNLKTTNSIDENNVGIYKTNNLKLSLAKLQALNNSVFVAYAEPNYIMREIPATNNNLTNPKKQALFEQQWGLKNQDYPGIDINVQPAWQKTKGNKNIIVAVIDSGINYIHPNLAENLWTNQKEIPNNNIDDDKNGYIDDVKGWNLFNNNNDTLDYFSHGTSVASIIAAAENGQGMLGVSPKTKFMPIKVYNRSFDTPTVAMFAQGIDYANKNGADVINSSMTYVVESQYAKEAIVKAKEAGIIIVTEAGDTASNNDAVPVYPAFYAKELANVITVTSIDYQGDFYSIEANYGLHSVNMAAPGVNILTANSVLSYVKNTGTSFAAPFVTGVIALIKSVNHVYSPEKIRDVLEQTTTKFSSLTDKTKTGGIVNAAKALETAILDEFAEKPLSLGAKLDRKKILNVVGQDFFIKSYQDNKNAKQIFIFKYDWSHKAYRIQINNQENYLALHKLQHNKLSVQDFDSQNLGQLWKLVPNSDDTFSINSLFDESLLFDLKSSQAKEGTQVVLNKKTQNVEDSQKWFIIPNKPVIANGFYQIRSSLNLQSVVDATDINPQDGTNVEIWDNNWGNNQSWYFIYDTKKQAYRIVSQHNYDLDLTWDSKKGDNVIVYDNSHENRYNDQYWVVERTADGFYMLKNLENLSMVLDLAQENTNNGSNIGVFPKKNNEDSGNQKWALTPIKDGIYDIVTSLDAKKLAEITAGEQFSGANVEIWDNNYGKHQKWNFEYIPNKNAYKISSAMNKQLFLAWNSNVADYKNVVVVDSSSLPESAAWFWVPEKTVTDFYVLKNLQNPNMVLDLSNANTFNGNNIGVYARHNGSCQQWNIRPV